MRKHLLIILATLLASCGVYNNSFECQPGKGIGCAPVGEVLDLIVEKEEGEDVFVLDKGTALVLREQEKEKLSKSHSGAKKTFYLIKDEEGNLKLIKTVNEAAQ